MLAHYDEILRVGTLDFRDDDDGGDDLGLEAGK